MLSKLIASEKGGHYRLLLLATVGSMAVQQVALAQTARPLDFDYRIGYRAEYDSNPDLRPSDEDADLVHALFADLSLSRDSSDFAVAVQGFADYLTYQDDTFDDEFRLDLDANAVWRAIPQRFHWVVENRAERAPLDTRALPTLANEQQTNLFTTGPDFISRLNATDQLVVGARYGNYYAEDTDDDAEQLSLSLSANRDFSPSRRVGLTLQAADLSFDDPINEDFQQVDAFATYAFDRSSQGNATNEFEFSLGYSFLSFDDRADIDSPLARAEWLQRRPEGTTFSGSFEYLLGSSASTTGTGAPLSAIELTQQEADGDPFERLSLRLGTERLIGAVSLGASISARSLDYDQRRELDEERYRLELSAGYALTPLIALNGFARYEQRDFTNVDQSDDIVELGFGAEYRRTPRLSLRFDTAWLDRDSSEAAFSADNLAVRFEIAFRR